MMEVLTRTGAEEMSEKAEKNIKKFLNVLNAQTPDDSDDIFGERNYYANLFQKTWLAKMLDEYDEKKRRTSKQLNDLLKEMELESENGFKNLSPQERYELNEKRRKQAEKIVLNADLGKKDMGSLVTPIVVKIYERGEFYDCSKYRLDRRIGIIREYKSSD